MGDLLLREIDLDELVEQVAERVVERLLPQLTDELQPMSRDDMAEWLGIGIATLDRERKAGGIPSVLIGGRRMFIRRHYVSSLEALDRFLAATQGVTA